MSPQTRRRRQEGQTLVFVALILSVLMVLFFIAIEVGGRMLQRAEVEDALQQATRASVQSFHYQGFAKNREQLRPVAEVKALAIQLFTTNLTNVGGLDQSAAKVASLVTWTILPTGGSCTVYGKTVTFTGPAICASLDAPMTGMPFKGSWIPHIETAATIDRAP